MKMPHAGELNRRITISNWLDVPDGTTGIDQTYSDDVIRWCKMEPVGAAIFHGSKQTNDNVTHRAWLRYESGIARITADQRMTHNGTEYAVRRVADLNDARQFLVIDVEELGAHGY